MSAMTVGQLRTALANMPLEDDEMVVVEVDLGPAVTFGVAGVVYEEPVDGEVGFRVVLIGGVPVADEIERQAAYSAGPDGEVTL